VPHQLRLPHPKPVVAPARRILVRPAPGADSESSDWSGCESDPKKRPLPAMRFYGHTDALNNKTFKLSDYRTGLPPEKWPSVK